MLVAASFLVGHLVLSITAGGSAATNSVVFVGANGSVAIENVAVSRAADGTSVEVRFAFGLPRQAPVRRWLEDDTLPICRTTWEKDGIRYTETVLLTRRAPGEWAGANLPPEDAVVMVQIFGENFTNDYTGASAEFSVNRAGRPLNLELRNGLVFSISGASNSFVAALEIPASGIVSTNGLRLEFQANMPPGNTGATVVKLPLHLPQGEAEIDQLRDLQFDQELQRVKRHWEKHGLGPAPVRFLE
jgi:hypothetical protein